MKVKNLAHGKKIVLIESNSSLRQVVVKLFEAKIGALVVSDDGENCLGIISERDIVRVLAEGSPNLSEMLVTQAMTRSVHSCTEETLVSELMQTMTEKKIRHIPVLDENDHLVSIVSIGDIVKAHVDELSSERAALIEYVQS